MGTCIYARLGIGLVSARANAINGVITRATTVITVHTVMAISITTSIVATVVASVVIGALAKDI